MYFKIQACWCCFSLQVKIHLQITLVKWTVQCCASEQHIISPTWGESGALVVPLDISKAQSSGVRSLLICSITAAGHQSASYSSIISFKCPGQKKSLFEGRKWHCWCSGGIKTRSYFRQEVECNKRNLAFILKFWIVLVAQNKTCKMK